MSTYRPDIDGLRAIAVVVVVLFHAHLGPFAGGFVGVDVFFVISGYLIVGIILDDIDAGRFSIAAFYERRLRRLFPALFAVLIACTVCGYLLFLPEEYRKFGRSVVATSAFVSNFLFWYEAGYFDTPAELKPLLHTWSLAVEEQFYLIFPAFLFAISKYAKQATTRIVSIIAVISFVLSTWSLSNHPDAAFYLPHTRMWELMIGALLVCAPIPLLTTQFVRTSAAVLGIVLIGISSTMFSSKTPFPGPAALLPCIGAALIIHAGRSGASFVGTLLGTRPFVYVGLISYSLYLWHWPILVFARAVMVRPLSPVEAAGLVILSFIVADLSWRFVESPFRGKHGRFTRKQIFMLGTVATVALLLVGTLIDIGNGMPGRVPSEVSIAAAGANDTDESFKRRCMNFAPEQVSPDVLCGIGAPGAPTFILWGDSHANSLRPAVAAAAASAGTAGLFAGSGGCAPLLGVSRTKERAFPCEAFNDSVLALIAHDTDLRTVVLASRWVLTADGTRYLNESGAAAFVRDAQSREVSVAENRAVFRRGLERTVSALHNAGKRVVIVGPVPEIGFDVPTTLARNLWFNRDFRIEPSRASFIERQSYVVHTLDELRAQSELRLVHPERVLCNESQCRVGVAIHPLYVDDNHLSTTGALELVRLFAPVFTNEAPTTGDAVVP